MPYCSQCGSENEPDSAFCESCGAKLYVPSPAGGPPVEPSPEAAPSSMCPGRRCLLIGGLVVVGLVVAAVVAFIATSGDDGDSGVRVERTAQPDGDEEEDEEVVTPEEEPTKAATKKPTAKPKPTKGPPTPTPEPPPIGFKTPEQAVAAYVSDSGYVYAGDCDTTTIEKDVGKVCSKMWRDEGKAVIYAIGLTFSEFGEWVEVDIQTDDTWLVVRTAGMTESGEPPW